jgi:hypothetical protein
LQEDDGERGDEARGDGEDHSPAPVGQEECQHRDSDERRRRLLGQQRGREQDARDHGRGV